jgi:hypothetical protein
MEIKIFNKDNWAGYREWYCNKNLQLDIYYTSAYLEIEAGLIKGEQTVIVIENALGHYVVYPFIMRQIPVKGFENYFDATSPYGYCGPYWASSDIKFKIESEKIICDYLYNNNVINEFVRYHYLYNEKNLFELNIDNSLNRKVVLVDVSETWEDVWSSHFSSTNRNLIRRMEKEEYKFFQTDSQEIYSSFIEMYYSTMNNANADPSYYFSTDYFTQMKFSLGSELKLFVVMKDDILFNAALFFETPEIGTYYLSARNLSFPKVPGTNFLLGNVIKSYCGGGMKYLNLGGGTAIEDENPLFKYKKNFSKDTKNFVIGKRVHLRDEYEELKKAYASLYGDVLMKEKSHLLQFYHS